jgi:hypothetical protein
MLDAARFDTTEMKGKEKAVVRVGNEAWSLNHDKPLLVDEIYKTRDSLKASFLLGEIFHALLGDAVAEPKSIDFTVEDGVGEMKRNVLRRSAFVEDKLPGQKEKKEGLIAQWINEIKSYGLISIEAFHKNYHFDGRRLVHVDTFNPVIFREESMQRNVDTTVLRNKIEAAKMPETQKESLLKKVTAYEELTDSLMRAYTQLKKRS